MTLSIETKEVHIVNEFDLSAYISEIYQRPYRLQQYMELGQDTLIRFSLPNACDDIDQIDAFNDWRNRDTNDHGFYEYSFERQLKWEREYGCPIEPIMDDLYERGLVPAGHYIVHVWW